MAPPPRETYVVLLGQKGKKWFATVPELCCVSEAAYREDAMFHLRTCVNNWVDEFMESGGTQLPAPTNLWQEFLAEGGCWKTQEPLVAREVCVTSQWRGDSSI